MLSLSTALPLPSPPLPPNANTSVGLLRGAAFLDMLAWGAGQSEDDGAVCPNECTTAALPQACGLARDERMGRMLHGYVVAGGFCRDPFVVGSLLLGLPSRDVVSWTVIISGCVLNWMLGKALDLFVMMLEDGVLPNNVTMLSVIQACSLMGASELFSPVHALVVLLDLEDDASVVNSLILVYAKNGFVEEAMRLLECLYLRRGDVCYSEDVIAALLSAMKLLFCNLPSLYQIE
jgi:pentatricopeptide repeat protein